jgi:hypothetical protein
MQLTQFSLIPAGYFSKIASYPGNAVNLLRTTIGTLGKQPPGGFIAGITGGEFR